LVVSEQVDDPGVGPGHDPVGGVDGKYHRDVADIGCDFDGPILLQSQPGQVEGDVAPDGAV
jgi:hypothetical protein